MNTQQLSMADLPRMFLGFDRMQNEFLSRNLDTSYPRYNVIKKGDTGYLIELAVPGWDKKDLEVSLHKNVLTRVDCVYIISDMMKLLRFWLSRLLTILINVFQAYSIIPPA